MWKINGKDHRKWFIRKLWRRLSREFWDNISKATKEALGKKRVVHSNIHEKKHTLFRKVLRMKFEGKQEFSPQGKMQKRPKARLSSITKRDTRNNYMTKTWDERNNAIEAYTTKDTTNWWPKTKKKKWFTQPK